MARINNAITFGAGFNIAAQGPIDSRMRVEYESDLINSSTWPSATAPLYNGLTVTVMETGDIWVLKDASNYQDKTNGTGWIKVGGGNTIEDAYVLPEASENKDKLFRLDNGEKDVYAAKLLSSETITTNRLPDEQQIDKGYIYDDCSGEYCYYKGSCTVVGPNGTFNGFLWINDGEYDIIVTTTDAENVTINDNKLTSDYSFIISGNVVTSEGEVYEASLDDGCYFIIPAIYNAPESAQIGNATFSDGNWGYKAVYSGEEITYNDSTWYKWTASDGYYITNKKASEIFGNFESYWMSDVQVVYYDGNGYDNELVVDDIGTIYIPQLNASDSEQVDNAYVNEDDGGDEVRRFYYTGVRKTLVVSDGSLYAYIWGETTSTSEYYDWNYATTVPANEIYGNEKVSLASLDDYVWTVSGDTLTNLEISLNDLEENNIIPIGSDSDTVSTVKYQRTETTEEWAWQDIIPTYASDSDIDDLFNVPTPTGNTITLIREQDSEQQAEGFIDLLVNTDSETMEYEGNTYYKWVQWANETDTTQPAVEHPNVVVLTNTLDITLPFNYESPEFEYYIRFNNEEWNIMGSNLHGDYTQKTVQ